jgi:hypothetical protein
MWAGITLVVELGFAIFSGTPLRSAGEGPRAAELCNDRKKQAFHLSASV